MMNAFSAVVTENSFDPGCESPADRNPTTPEVARKTPRHRVAAASTSCTYNTTCGNRSSNTRGWTENDACDDKSLSSRRRSVRREAGLSQKVVASVMHVPASATNPIGTSSRRSPTPAACSATISLSADIRPSPMSTPTSTAIGSVNASAGGSVHKNSSVTVPKPPECRTTRSISCTSRGHEKYECKYDEAQQGVGHYFAANVSIDQAHRKRGVILALRCGERRTRRREVRPSCFRSQCRVAVLSAASFFVPNGPREEIDR